MKIVISDIPGFFPSGYPEQFYFNARSIRKGRDTLTTETAEKYQIKDDSTYRKRKIQTVFYDKYTIELTSTESIDIDLMNIAGKMIVYQDNGEQHNAELLEFAEPEPLLNSEFREYTLTYRDLNSKEVINHLSATSLTDGIVKFKNGITTAYSKIYPQFGVSEYERSESKDNFINVVSVDSAFRTVEFISYVTQDELLNIKAGMSASYLSDMYIESSESTYTPLEVPELIIEDSELENLIPIRIIVKYEQLLNYPFEVENTTTGYSISADPSWLYFKLIDSESKSVAITTNGSGWSITNISDSWITATKSSDNISVSVSTASSKRSGTIEVTSLDDANVKVIINIYQDFTAV